MRLPSTVRTVIAVAKLHGRTSKNVLAESHCQGGQLIHLLKQTGKFIKMASESHLFPYETMCQIVSKCRSIVVSSAGRLGIDAHGRFQGCNRTRLLEVASSSCNHSSKSEKNGQCHIETIILCPLHILTW